MHFICPCRELQYRLTPSEVLPLHQQAAENQETSQPSEDGGGWTLGIPQGREIQGQVSISTHRGRNQACCQPTLLASPVTTCPRIAGQQLWPKATMIYSVFSCLGLSTSTFKSPWGCVCFEIFGAWGLGLFVLFGFLVKIEGTYSWFNFSGMREWVGGWIFQGLPGLLTQLRRSQSRAGNK